MAISPARYAPQISAPFVYYLLAAVLGAGWFLVLLIPTWTRSWLIGEPRMIGWTMGEMVVTSVIVAAIFKRAIQLSDSWGAHILRSLTIPYAGSFVYLTVWNARVWTRTLLFGGLANLHDTMAVYYWGMCYAVVACFVVVPYGLLCQVVLKEFLDRADANG